MIHITVKTAIPCSLAFLEKASFFVEKEKGYEKGYEYAGAPKGKF